MAGWELKFDQYERVDSVLITYGSVNTLAMISFRSWMVRVGIFEDRFKNENLLLGICTFNLVIDWVPRVYCKLYDLLAIGTLSLSYVNVS